MSLQLVIGASGSGKTTYLYQSVIREAMQHPEENYMIIVPEQFTMQTQKNIVKMHPAHGILNIDVLSFQRLAYRIFEETGEEQTNVLTETGKSLILRKVSADLGNELGLLRQNLNKPGYIAQVKSILSEFAQYDISDETLEDMISLSKKSGMKELLSAKLQDLLLLKKAFTEYKKDRFITGEELLELFARDAWQSSLLRKSHLVFDCFTGFTPVQLTALRVLLQIVPDMQVTLCAQPQQILTPGAGEHELFALSRKTMHTLYHLAKETNTQILEPVCLTGSRGRFGSMSGLQVLENHLFRYGRKYVHHEKPEDISLRQCANPAQEVRYAAGMIRKMIDHSDLRYREIAIVAGNPGAYQKHIRRIFREYDIPVFLDEKVALIQNPCLEFVRGLLQVTEKNYSYESMFALIRTGFACVSQEDADLAENYCIARGIRGRKQWEEPWTAVTKTINEEDTAIAESVRSKVMAYLGPFSDGMPPEASVKQYCHALSACLESCEIEAQLKAREESLREKGDMAKAMEFSQVYDMICNLIEETQQLLGEEIVSRSDFKSIIEAGFEEAKVGVIPPGIDQIQTGDLERTRMEGIRVLFFLGMNDGWVPPQKHNGGIVSELERDYLEQLGIELAPGAKQTAVILRFYLYLCLTKPSQQLLISYSLNASDGTSMRPSYLIGTIRRLFPLMEIIDEDEKARSLSGIMCAAAGVDYLAVKLSEAARKKETDGELLELLRQYRESSYAEQISGMMKACLQGAAETTLSSEISRLLYGDEILASVTRLEQFASCQFEHFLQYGLRLRERERMEIRPVDIGNICHNVLAMFSEKIIERGYNWYDITDEQQNILLQECVEENVRQYSSGMFLHNHRNAAQSDRILRLIRRTVWALMQQVRSGDFIPSSFEVSFDAAGELSEVQVMTDENKSIRLKGRIDRLDLMQTEAETYLKVIDYKTGHTKLDLTALLYGLQLQLCVYMIAAKAMQEKSASAGSVKPGAMFYYRMHDPIVDAEPEDDDETIRQKILRELKPDGLICQDEEVIDGLDRNLVKKSDVIPVERNANGSLGARSHTVSKEQMDTLLLYVRRKIDELGKEMAKGGIRTDPYKRKEQTACDYCTWKNACAFDRRTPGNEYRTLKEFPDELFWKTITAQDDDLKKGELV